MVMAARINEHVFDRGNVSCACNNKVGILAPKEKLQGIDIEPDAACSKPGVHVSESPGRFCSCDKGKAKNWEKAVGDAQKRLDDALQPKMEALTKLLEDMQTKLGVEMDVSSLGKVKPKVNSFPRRWGEGLWVCCCQSQTPGKCEENAEMENGIFTRGFHHKAPDRACNDKELKGPEEAVEPEASEAEVLPPMEEAVAPVEPSVPEPEPEVPVSEGGPEENEEETTEASGPEPEASKPSRAAFLREIQAGTTLKKPKVPRPDTPAPWKPSTQGDLMSALKEGVKLKPAGERVLPPKPDVSTPRDKLLNQIQDGVQLKPVKERKAEVEDSRPATLLDQLAQSDKFKKLRENVGSNDDEEEEVADDEW